MRKAYKLWYENSAERWVDGLPVGNGRVAAMVINNDTKDRLALNHEELWRGNNRTRCAEENAEYLPLVRKMLKKEKWFEATVLTNLFFGGVGGQSGIDSRVDSYQPAGDLFIEYPKECVLKKRCLNIANALHTAERDLLGSKIITSVFVDCDNGGIMIKIEADEPVSYGISLSRVEDAGCETAHYAEGSSLVFKGKFNTGIEYEVLCTILTDATVSKSHLGLCVSDAKELVLRLNIAVGDKAVDINKEFDECLKIHKEKFSDIFYRYRFSISEGIADIPTDKLINEARDGKISNYLEELYIAYSRYLLISSAIAGKLPANLQGKWNESINPPWRCDYHLNINLQMNYWMAEMCNLSELTAPLFNYIERLAVSGRESAKALYGVDGVWMPLQTDIWARATPESYGYAALVGVASWLALHFWQHYIYSGDIEFLKDRVYPLFKYVAAFYEGYLEADENGVLQIMPSQSPENSFYNVGMFTESCAIGISSAFDVELAYEAFRYAISASEILGVDEEDRRRWSDIQSKLPNLGCDSNKRLLEWDREMIENDPGHRHMSPMYGIYPSDMFSDEKFIQQREWAENLLNHRFNHGKDMPSDCRITGWSMVWMSCLYARLGNREKFYECFSPLLLKTSETLLDLLRDFGIFQIDANLGAAAAACEAVVSCEGECVTLLKGLPEKWKDGSARGVKVPGGHELELSWKDGKVTDLSVLFGYSEKINVVGLGEFSGKCGEQIKIL